MHAFLLVSISNHISVSHRLAVMDIYNSTPIFYHWAKISDTPYPPLPGANFLKFNHFIPESEGRFQPKVNFIAYIRFEIILLTEYTHRITFSSTTSNLNPVQQSWLALQHVRNIQVSRAAYTHIRRNVTAKDTHFALAHAFIAFCLDQLNVGLYGLSQNLLPKLLTGDRKCRR